MLKGLDPRLDMGRGNLTAALPQKPGTIIEVPDVEVSENDTSLRYLDRILEAAEINRTTGNTINIFIVNMNE